MRGACTGGPPTEVLWHDLECGSYTADLPLWRELAEKAHGPVLDVGAGTGRVALDLARAGYEVIALDRDEELLAALRERGAGLPVRAVAGDARSFDLSTSFALIIAPMQILQLLGGADGVAGFLRSAAAHLRPGGLLAATLAQAVPFAEDGELEAPAPDMLRAGGWLYASRPVAVRPAAAGGAWLERCREAVAPDNTRTAALDRVLLDAVHPDDVLAAGRSVGLRPLPGRSVGATEDHVGSEVVMLEAP